VAVTCASNLVGSLTDVAEITRLAHAAGALVFLDAVHYAPHAAIDVQSWGCDFLVCSSYKFFGPHLGILWGKREHLEQLQPYKLRPASEQLPYRWMTGTQNHECIAGLTGTLAYLANIGQQQLRDTGVTQQRAGRPQFIAALSALRAHEQNLLRQLLEGLRQRPHCKIWGIADSERLAQRAPTVAITHAKLAPQELAQRLAQRQIYSWSGNSYALGLTERLGLESQGGVLRLGLVHYNTADEVAKVLQALDELKL
jgi:selenocysteine lyase/cysteine desulfurase